MKKYILIGLLFIGIEHAADALVDYQFGGDKPGYTRTQVQQVSDLVERLSAEAEPVILSSDRRTSRRHAMTQAERNRAIQYLYADGK